MNIFNIKRFNGEEIYNVSKADAEFTELNGSTYLHLIVSTDTALETLEDSVELKALPNAEIFLKVSSSDKSLIENTQLNLKESYNSDIKEHLALIYYIEHEDLNNNVVNVSKISENKYKVLWEATTVDVLHYDGSKPDSQITIEAEFTLKE